MKRALCILTALTILLTSLPASAAMLGASIITESAAPEPSGLLLITDAASDFDYITFSEGETTTPTFDVTVVCDPINIHYLWNNINHIWELTSDPKTYAAITLTNNGTDSVDVTLTLSDQLPSFLSATSLVINPDIKAPDGQKSGLLTINIPASENPVTCYLVYTPHPPTGIVEITNEQVSINIALSQPSQTDVQGGATDGEETV